jgi:hypothetical protein
MIRLTAPAAGVALVLSTGCMHDDDAAGHNALGWKPPPGSVVTPTSREKEMAKLAPADKVIQERVATLGRDILTRNVFPGVDAIFTTLGVKESVLFHVGSKLYISQGLVEKCPSDGELAGLLCYEMGHMVAEIRTAKALGRNVDAVPEVTTEDQVLFPGGKPVEVAQQGERPPRDNQPSRPGSRPELPDPTAIARDLLKGANYSPAELDQIEPLLKLSPRSDQLRRQFGGSAPAPDPWQK